MNALLPALAGVLFAGGSYLLMQRTLTRIVLGIAMWGHAVNIVLITAGGPAGRAPLLEEGEALEPTGFADSLAQAMALTAIVITFAIVVFLLALAYRSFTLTGADVAEDDLEDRRIAEHAYLERSEAVVDDEDEDDEEGRERDSEAGGGDEEAAS